MDNEVLKNSENRSGQKYAELLCDFMFKRLFGSEENKDVLIYFLNMVMKDVEIDDVDEGYQVSFPLPNYLASPKFWGIEDENENENAHRIYVIERETHEAED